MTSSSPVSQSETPFAEFSYFPCANVPVTKVQLLYRLFLVTTCWYASGSLMSIPFAKHIILSSKKN